MSSHFPTSLSLHTHTCTHMCTHTHKHTFSLFLSLSQAAPNTSLFPHIVIETFSFTFCAWLRWTPSCYTPHTDTPPSISSNPNPPSQPLWLLHIPSPATCVPLPQAGNWQAHTQSSPPEPLSRTPGHPARGFCSEARRAQLPPQEPWVPAMQAAAGAVSSSAPMHRSAEKGTRYNLFRKQ